MSWPKDHKPGADYRCKRLLDFPDASRKLSPQCNERCREKVVLRVKMRIEPAMGKASAGHYFSNADVGNATFPGTRRQRLPQCAGV